MFTLSTDQLLHAYRVMRTIRAFEERLHVEFATGEIPGFVHLYAGEEASAAGVMAHLRDDDCIASTHRGHGHCIAKGVDVHGMMAEIYGKKTGVCQGKGGSMHIADLEKGMLGANGIVGAGAPLAAGAALAAKLKGSDAVAVAFFGDGGSNEGAVFEAMNLAPLLRTLRGRRTDLPRPRRSKALPGNPRLPQAVPRTHLPRRPALRQRPGRHRRRGRGTHRGCRAAREERSQAGAGRPAARRLRVLSLSRPKTRTRRTIMARKISYQQAINEALAQEMRRDPSVFIMGEDNAGGAGAPGEDDAWGGVLGVTKGLYHQFPGRVLDTPLSEIGYVGAAVGAATRGMRPVCELMFVDFAGCCLDQILNQAAKFRYMFGGKAVTPLVIRTMVGAGLRAAAQHSQMLTSLWTHIPGLKVVCPSSPYDAKGLLVQAIRDNDPVIFCEHKLLYSMQGEVPEELYSVPFGEANFLRDGDDVTLVTYGRMVHLALDAAASLARQGISCEVLDLRSTSPLDEDSILESVEKTGRLVVVDEANPRCSMATDIAALVAERAFSALRAPIRRVTAPHTPVPFSDALEDLYIPDAAKIEAAVRQALEERDAA